MCEITKENDSLQRQTENKDENSHVPPIKKNVPELRFPEFKGEYFSTKLEHISDICGGKRLPKGYSLTSTKNNHPYITISDMNKHTVLLDNIKYVPNEIVKKIEKYVIFDSDLYITVAGTIGIVGKIPSTLNGANLTENADKITNIQINQNYLLYYLNTGALKKLIEKNRTDNAQPKLALKEIRKMSIIFPSDEEQEKIANFLSAIDKKIELMEKKHTLYQSIKKYILSNIFPVNNKKPSLRFKEFKNERKFIKLNEILSYSSSKHSLNKLEDNIGKYELYGAEGVVKHVNFFDMDKDYISIIKDGAGVCKLHLCKPYSSIVGTMGYLTLKNTNYNLKYIYYQLLTLNLKKYVIGTTIPHIYFKDYSKEYILVPNLIEQGKIANLMLLLDTKIMKIQKQIDNLKKFKKGLLQKMFC